MLLAANPLARSCRLPLLHCSTIEACRTRRFVARPATVPNPNSPPREVFILGLTQDGRAFRPSDWAERLAGAMSSFRPGGARMGRSAQIGYSPYCVPNLINGIKCVIVNEALRELEPMAWDFVMNFARDNQLQVADACLLPDDPAPTRPAS
jgi:hypothetical protein